MDTIMVPERLTVTTALIGLLAVGGRLIDILWDLDSAPERESAFLNQALQAVKQCRSSIHVLHKTLSLLESSQLPFPERSAWIRVEHLVAVLTDTVLAFSELQAMCDVIDLELETVDYGAVRQQHGAAMATLCTRIRWLNLSCTMMMTVLKCPGDSDAQSSREGLEQRLTRLLTSTSELSSRMRTLQAGFAASVTTSPLATYTTADRYDSSTMPRSASADLSGQTLASAPVLSIIPLPVMTDEIVDGNEFYTFEFARQASDDLGLLMHEQTGPETYKLRARAASTVADRQQADKKKKWTGLAGAARILGRKKRRKRWATAEQT